MGRTLLALLVVTSACQGEPQPPVAAAEPTAEPTAPAPAPTPVLPAWRFLQVDGEVRLDGKAATVDAEIGKASTIEVAAGGRALITLGAKSIIEVREKTRLTLGSSKRKAISARLLAGQLWSFFGGAADYEVVTDNAVAGVRGTVFYVNAEQKQQTIVCACSHAVRLESLDGKKPTVDEVTAAEWEHLGTAFVRKGKRVKTKRLGAYPNPPNHPDAAGKELLALMPD